MPVILYGAVLLSSVMSIASYWFSDKIVIAMSGGIPVTMNNNPELYRIVENLAITAGLPMPKLYIVPEMAPNAFATGRNPDHAAIAVTEGLLEKLDRSEIEGVLAHELSHIGNRDMLVGTVIVVLVGFISIISDISLRMGISNGNRRDNDRSDGILMIIGIVLAIIAPIAASLIQLAISRKREFLADASGALLTRYPEGLANALIKISNDPVLMKNPSTATAHLWLTNPFKGRKSNMAKLFMTHPPIEERVRALLEMSK